MLILLSLGAFPHPDIPLNTLFKEFPNIFPTSKLSVTGFHCFFKSLFDRVADSFDGATLNHARFLRDRLLENGIRRQLYEGVCTDVMDNYKGVSGPLSSSTRTI